MTLEAFATAFTKIGPIVELDGLADVFLSYARSDRSVAAEVAHSLERAGFTVWWDREIRAGSDFAIEI